MKTLIIGDIHINEVSIPEIELIFKEILKIKADRIIQLGDYYDHNKPTPLELKFGTKLAKKLKKKYKDVTIISGTGTHDILHGTSIIEYLKELGIRVIKGDYIVDNMLFAHWMVNESNLSYGSGKCGIKDLKKYDKVFLGHLHLFQELKKGKVYHPGSIRYVNFNEVCDKKKVIALLDEANKVTFASLKSPYKMKEVTSIKEVTKLKTGKSKIRLVISSFDQFKKEVSEFDKYRHKFFEFKVKLDFNQRKSTPNVDKESVTTGKRRLEDILREGIKKVKDKDVKKILEEVYDEKN